MTETPAKTRLELRSTPSDYAALGLTEVIAPWEDGQRVVHSDQSYEWWYFDARVDDGTVVVAWLAHNWHYGTRERVVSLEIIQPRNRLPRAAFTSREPGSFATERCDVRIGPHSLVGDLDRYVLTIEPGGASRVGCALTLTRTVPSFRPATGHLTLAEDYAAWLVAVPNGGVSGTITIDGRSIAVKGIGYHDHNWGNAPPGRMFKEWWWAHGTIGERTVVVYRMQGHATEDAPSMLYVGRAQGIDIAASGEEVAFTTGPDTGHPDNKHTTPIPSSIRFSAEGTGVALVPRQALLSHDFLTEQLRLEQRRAGISGDGPWYSRFAGDLYLSPASKSALMGQAILEHFEF